MGASMKRVLIIGGGTGATLLANTLDKRRFDVIVLSKSSAHVFQPALLYLAFKNANPDIVRNERRLLARHVRFVEEAVTRIDLRGRSRGSARSIGGSEITTPPSRRPRRCGRTSTPSGAVRSCWGRAPR